MKNDLAENIERDLSVKQFIYLDTDIVSSIIAQSEKGYVTQQTCKRQVLFLKKWHLFFLKCGKLFS